VIPEAPYLFSVAALSVTLAGFAGLVAAFRRGSELTPIDIYRLRQIAEFGLGDALIALSTMLRQRRLGVAGRRGSNTAIIVIDFGAVAAGVATFVVGSVGLFEWQLLFLLSRPMLAFTLVLASLRHA
jgi:hypothetical protein